MQRRSLITLLLLLGLVTPLIIGAAPRQAAARLDGARGFSSRSASDSLLHVLALRVEFVQDQVATTTGTGRFDYGTSTTYSLDRSPHDRSYFQHQLLALDSYFSRVSGNRLRVTGEVFPEAATEAYQLAHDMVYYSGQEDEKKQQQRWAELLRDAVQLAAAGGGIDFSRYDYLMVFHAGVGQDFAFDFDTTPYDIQSVYMDAPSLAAGLGQDPATFKGIECPGGIYLRDGIILPETQNQESYTLGLLGTMTLLFGSQIGMPSLFDTESGRAGIGSWGLMDQGSYNFQGFIPAEPSAWEKIYMGWDEALTVQSATEARIGSSRTSSVPRILKVPVTSSEYYLIENRQRDPNRDRITIGRDENGRKAEFDSTGRVVAPSGIGVLTRIDEYDFGLPGSGLLIWHVDEEVIAANLTANTVNNNRDHRGVDLVECDGAQDIGYIYSFLDAGYGTESGDWWDPWWAGNESHKIVNESDKVVFSEASIPNSGAYSGAVTRIRLDQFSPPDTVMTLRISSGLIQPGFPRLEAAGENLVPSSLALLPGPAGESGLLVAATRDGRLYGWRGDGTKPFAEGNHVIAWPLAAPASAPLFADLDRNGREELYYFSAGGDILAYDLLPRASAPGLLDLRGIYPMGDSLSMRIALTGGADPALIIGSSRGRISAIRIDPVSGSLTVAASLEGNGSAVSGLAVSPDGLIVAACDDGLITALRLDPLTLVWQKGSSLTSAQPLVADFDGVPGYEIALVGREGALARYSIDGVFQGGYQPPVALSGITAPALGDIDLDGLPEIICVAREGAAVFEYTGAMTLNYPAVSAVSDSTGKPGSPLFLRRLDNSEAWLAFAGDDGLVQAFNQHGERQPGFPLSGGISAESALLLGDVDGDGILEMAAAGKNGSLNLWDLGTARSTCTVWGEAGGAQRAFALAGASVTPVPGSDLMLAKKVFSYPNPVTEGAANIRFSLARPVERVLVRIFDLAGNLVGELSRENLLPGDHEMAWEVSKVQSGVYFARVTAQSGSDSRFEIIKIAVTH